MWYSFLVSLIIYEMNMKCLNAQCSYLPGVGFEGNDLG